MSNNIKLKGTGIFAAAALTAALVAGNNLDYLWILSREKTIPETFKQRFLEKAKALGYKTENLIWVKQD